jgi:type I restriction enzyme S subunit
LAIEAAIPEGWSTPRLADVSQPSSAKVEPSQCPEAPYLSLEHIESATGRIIQNGIGSDVHSTKAVFHRGDVLYGRLRPYLNKVAIPTFDGICSTDILVFRPVAGIDNRYLARFLSTAAVVDFASHNSAGVQLPRIGLEKLGELQMPLPPLAEQKRIVGKLEELLIQVNAGRARLSHVAAILKRFRQSVLAAACSGVLTDDWPVSDDADLLTRIYPESLAARGRRTVAAVDVHVPPSGLEIPSHWAWATFAQVCSLVTKGSSPEWQGFKYLDRGIRFLRSQNVRWGRLDLTECAFLDPSFNRSHPSSVIASGDVLLNLVGASVGRAAVADHQAAGANCNQAVGIIRLVRDGIDSRWVLTYLLSPWAQQHIALTKVDVARANFNLDDIRAMAIPIPPLSEQREIMRRVESLFALLDTLDRRVAAASARAHALTQSILAKAFRGELVPTEAELARAEGRDYESAQALLARIQSEHAASAPTPKGRHRAVTLPTQHLAAGACCA